MLKLYSFYPKLKQNGLKWFLILFLASLSFTTSSNLSVFSQTNSSFPGSPITSPVVTSPSSSSSSSTTSDPRNDPYTKMVKNGYDGKSTTQLKLGTEIRDDDIKAPGEYARLNPTDTNIQNQFQSGTLNCTQMGGILPGINLPPLVDKNGNPLTYEGYSIVNGQFTAHPTRRIGVCQDGYYSLSNRMIDTSGNIGEWSEAKWIERDTVSPVAPMVSAGKSGSIGNEYLKIQIAGEAGGNAEIVVQNEYGFNQTFVIGLNAEGIYSSDRFLSLTCGQIKYTVRARVIDRAGNEGDFSDYSTVISSDCPRCSSKDGKLLFPVDHPNATFDKTNPLFGFHTPVRPDHNGIDINGNGVLGAPIVAAASGTVSRIWYEDNGFGNSVYINHGDGLQTRYAHMLDSGSNYVKLGQQVYAGEQIGRLGSTGQSSGPHLHFEVLKNGTHQDPNLYLGSGANVVCDIGQGGNGDEEFTGYPQIDSKEASDLIENFLENTFKETTVVENHSQNWQRSLEQLKSDYGNNWKDNIGPHLWCGLWVMDLQNIETWNYGNGYDGQIILNPYFKTPYIIKNGIWDKYAFSGGPCSSIGIPRVFEENAPVNDKSNTVKGKAWRQYFERGVFKENTIYAFNFYDQCSATQNGIVCSQGYAAYFVLKEVANQYQQSGGSGSTYNFPTGDTEPMPEYCRQRFEWNTSIEKCGYGIEKPFYVDGTKSNTDGKLKDGVDKNNRKIKFEITDSADKKYATGLPDGKDVWIVVHGWNDDYNQNFQKIAANIKSEFGDSVIVLALDWSEASNNNNYPGPGGVMTIGHCNAATWIKPVADEASEVLKKWGLTDNRKLNIVGHSLGSLMGAEIGLNYGKSNYLIGLDTPSNWGCYPDYLVQKNPPVQRTPYKNTSRFSRSFVGSNSLAGSDYLAKSAHEPIAMNFLSLIDTGQEHALVVKTFARLTDQNDYWLSDKSLGLRDKNDSSKFLSNPNYGGMAGELYVTEENNNGERNFVQYGFSNDNGVDRYYGTNKTNQMQTIYLKRANTGQFEGGDGDDIFSIFDYNNTLVQDFKDPGDRLKVDRFSSLNFGTTGGGVRITKNSFLGQNYTDVNGGRVDLRIIRDAYIEFNRTGSNNEYFTK